MDKLKDTFELTNEREDDTYIFEVEDIIQPDFEIRFNPKKGKVKGGSRESITGTLKVKNPINYKANLTIHLGQTSETFISVNVATDTGVYGVDINEITWIEHDGYKLPQVLVTLDEAFKEKDGFHSEGVLRLAGQQNLMKEMKNILNKNEGKLNFEKEYGVNEIANLIKLWFRELKLPILNILTKDQVMNSSEKETCFEVYKSLPVNERNLLDWLFDLLVKIAKNKDENKMTLQNLAIVVAPNLYETENADPMEGLTLSQKVVQFCHNVLICLDEQSNA